MKLSVAANYDLEPVPTLATYPVAEVYGKLPSDIVGGGRPTYMAAPLRPKDLAAYVAALGRHGIAFNYLLNTSCLANHEWGRPWQKKLMRFLDRLGVMGIRRVTVSTPYLLERIKTAFPEFRVKVGIYAQIDTPRRARFWQDLGADALTLESFSINRDFATLRAIRDAVDCELQLVANHPCLPNCAMQPYHQNGFAHSSDGSHRLFIDYCFLNCTRRRLEDPSLLIKAGWIRPEDVAFYETMGYQDFKLLERGMPSQDLIKRVDAYSNRASGDDLAALILPYGFKEPQQKPACWLLRHFFKPRQVNPIRLRPFYSLLRRQGMLFALERHPLRIDPAKLPPDFIHRFDARRCALLDCGKCRCCEEIAAEAVTVDPAFRRQQIKALTDATRTMVDGKLWNV